MTVQPGGVGVLFAGLWRVAMGSGRESLLPPDAKPDLGETSSGSRPDPLPEVPCRAARVDEQADGVSS